MSALTTTMSRLVGLVNRLAPWLLLFGVVCLTWFLAAIIWFLLAPPKAQHLTPLDLPASSQISQADGMVFDVFEPAKSNDAASESKAANEFNLSGVFLSRPHDSSAAVISVDGKSKRYRLGDNIDQTDYKLVSVAWNQVVLENEVGDKIDVFLTQDDFELDQRDLFNHDADSSSAKNIARPSANRTALTAKGLSAKLGRKAQKHIEPQSQRKKLDDAVDNAIEQLKNSPASYLNRMGVMATGDGYEVTAAMNGEIRANIGLQAGDKVISVNGQSIGQPQQDAQLLEEIKRTGQAEIQVQRGSQVITIRQQF